MLKWMLGLSNSSHCFSNYRAMLLCFEYRAMLLSHTKLGAGLAFRNQATRGQINRKSKKKSTVWPPWRHVLGCRLGAEKRASGRGQVHVETGTKKPRGIEEMMANHVLEASDKTATEQGTEGKTRRHGCYWIGK